MPAGYTEDHDPPVPSRGQFERRMGASLMTTAPPRSGNYYTACGMGEDQDEPVDSAEAPPDPLPAAEPPMRKPRRTLIGPFTARQLGIVNAVVLWSALVLYIAT